MILQVGSINIDHIIKLERLPKQKETIYTKNSTTMLGGKGANQIIAAGRLGAEASFIAVVGKDDANKEMAYSTLRWANVDTSLIAEAEGINCGEGFVFVYENGENNILINTAANALITDDVLKENEDAFEKADIVVAEFGATIKTCYEACRIAKEHGCFTIVNPAPTGHIDDDFYKLIDLITPNEVEAQDYCGFEITDEDSAIKAGDFFHSKGVKNVVITMGSKGAYVSDGRMKMMIASHMVDAVDTSGAGDSFNGGLAYALDRGQDLFTAAAFANAVAACCVQKEGTALSMPSLNDVEKLLGKGEIAW